MGALEYSAELAALVDAKKTLPSSSRYEVEIRASTVIAVDMLHQVIQFAV